MNRRDFLRASAGVALLLFSNGNQRDIEQELLDDLEWLKTNPGVAACPIHGPRWHTKIGAEMAELERQRRLEDMAVRHARLLQDQLDWEQEAIAAFDRHRAAMELEVAAYYAARDIEQELLEDLETLKATKREALS